MPPKDRQAEPVDSGFDEGSDNSDQEPEISEPETEISQSRGGRRDRTQTASRPSQNKSSGPDPQSMQMTKSKQGVGEATKKGGKEAQKKGDKKKKDDKDEGGHDIGIRLDLNLDIEIQLKAKIRGDLTLSLM